MLIALIVGTVAFAIALLRKRGLKKAVIQSSVAFAISMFVQFAVFFTYFMINGVPTT